MSYLSQRIRSRNQQCISTIPVTAAPALTRSTTAVEGYRYIKVRSHASQDFISGRQDVEEVAKGRVVPFPQNYEFSSMEMLHSDAFLHRGTKCKSITGTDRHRLACSDCAAKAPVKQAASSRRDNVATLQRDIPVVNNRWLLSMAGGILSGIVERERMNFVISAQSRRRPNCLTSCAHQGVTITYTLR